MGMEMATQMSNKESLDDAQWAWTLRLGLVSTLGYDIEVEDGCLNER